MVGVQDVSQEQDTGQPIRSKTLFPNVSLFDASVPPAWELKAWPLRMWWMLGCNQYKDASFVHQRQHHREHANPTYYVISHPYSITRQTTRSIHCT
jgi:hypothetical protein